jgi:transcription-repair coupling factor (superfamily II helicase)
LRFQGLNEILRQSDDYKNILSAAKKGKIPCQIHGLSESQKAYIS